MAEPAGGVARTFCVTLTRRTTLLAVLASVAAAAHVPGIAEHLEEAPYMGVLFALFAAACAGLAVAAIARPGRATATAAVALCGAALATYAATRLVAFPQLGDDVGNWFESLGVVSVLAEAAVVATALKAARA